MAGHHHLIPIPPQPLRQLHADAVTLIGCHLARLEALIGVEREDRTPIPEVLPHSHHSLVRVSYAVDGADKVNLFIRKPLGFLSVCRVVNSLGQVVPLGLFGISGVIKDTLDGVLDGPNLCSCHGQTASLSQLYGSLSPHSASKSR